MGEGRYIEGRREIGVSKLKLVSSDVFLMTRNISYNMKCTLARQLQKKSTNKMKIFFEEQRKMQRGNYHPLPQKLSELMYFSSLSPSKIIS